MRSPFPRRPMGGKKVRLVPEQPLHQCLFHSFHRYDHVGPIVGYVTDYDRCQACDRLIRK